MNCQKNKKNFLLFSLGLTVLFLALVQIFASHCLSTAGKTVGELELQAEKISRQNFILAEEIDALGSLSAVRLRAEALGFRATENLVYLTSPAPLAWSRPALFAKAR